MLRNQAIISYTSFNGYANLLNNDLPFKNV